MKRKKFMIGAVVALILLLWLIPASASAASDSEGEAPADVLVVSEAEPRAPNPQPAGEQAPANAAPAQTVAYVPSEETGDVLGKGHSLDVGTKASEVTEDGAVPPGEPEGGAAQPDGDSSGPAEAEDGAPGDDPAAPGEGTDGDKSPAPDGEKADAKDAKGEPAKGKDAKGEDTKGEQADGGATRGALGESDDPADTEPGEGDPAEGAEVPATRGAPSSSRATFDVGATVRSKWISLAGGQNNITAIRQYSGDELPEGISTTIISASDSEVKIHSWFEDGTIYYWSEDTNPKINQDASYMFYGFGEATYIDAASFDTSETEDMEAMFADCGKLETVDVSGFDTSAARCMYCMFINDSSLKSLDVSHFNTTNTTYLSHSSYGSLCGMFLGCSALTELDLSSFDMTQTSWPYHTQNMFPGCTGLQKLILGPLTRFNSYTALSGSWTHEDTGLTLSGSALTSQYNQSNALVYSGTWIRNMPEGHYYRTDGSLGQTNLWEVHTPNDRFKGYCLNLNRFGVGEELDRVFVEDDTDIEAIICTEAEGSTHGYGTLGSNMREALITLIYFGWNGEESNEIQRDYNLSDQDYLEITQNAIWDFTDRYDSPAGPALYKDDANKLAAYNKLVSMKYTDIDGQYILFLYKSWDKTKQNLLSIMGVDDQEYGGVAVRKQNADGSENLAGAEFTVYDAEGKEAGTMVTSANGVAYICRTDHTAGLPLGTYTVKETKPPAGYKISDVQYTFEITKANEIVTMGLNSIKKEIEEEMIFYDDHDDTYVGGGIGIIKQSDTGAMLAGAEFTIYDADNKVVTVLVTNDGGVAATGKQDLPLGTYTIKETRAPAGCLIQTETKTVTVTTDGILVEVPWENTEKSGSVQLQAKKVLDIPDQALEADQFTFQLLDDHYNVIQTATNDADGTVVFNPIEYKRNDLGYKNYHIVEVIGDEEGIRYDRHVEDVTVTIYDTDSEKLDCTPIYDADGAVFINKPGAKKPEITIQKKKLNTDETVAGAMLEIRDPANRLIGSWTSSGEAQVVKLDPGAYTLREITAPEGYFEISDVRFEVREDGTLSSGSDAVSVAGSAMDVYDKPISSTELVICKTDKDTGDALAGAEFTLKGTGESTYQATVTTDKDGKAVFDGLETGTYTLTETSAPKGYIPYEESWMVKVVYNRAISKTPNINTTGSAFDVYPNNLDKSDTIQVIGNPDSIQVALKYQTEDDYDYLCIKDAGGNVITQDKNGNTIGDTRTSYLGRLWGGLGEGKINICSFDLESMESMTFHFVSDPGLGAYGYYAVVTWGSGITITDASGNPVSLADGVYTIPNKKYEPASVQFSGQKTLEGRELKDKEFSFTLTGKEDGIVETVTNDGEGKISFSALTYNEPGTYTYQVQENVTDETGVTIDTRVYDITVAVAADENGTLSSSISVDGESATGRDLDFTNTYTAPPKPHDDPTPPPEPPEPPEEPEVPEEPEIPETTSYTVQKIWKDRDNAQGKRPDSVTVYLYQNDAPYHDMSAVLSESNGWTYTWTELPAEEGPYSAREAAVDGYTGSAETTGSATVFTNTLNETPPDKPTTHHTPDKPKPDVIDIDEPDVPLSFLDIEDEPEVPEDTVDSDNPFDIEIEEPDVPKSMLELEDDHPTVPKADLPLITRTDTPQTGDSSSTALWACLGLLSMAGIVGLSKKRAQ